MKNVLILAACWCWAYGAGAEEWSWKVTMEESGTATLQAVPNQPHTSEEPHPRGEPCTLEELCTLEDAVRGLPQGVCIESLRLDPLLQASDTQRELAAYLQEHYPQEHGEALASAGNLHNPKVQAVRKPFEEALLATTQARRIDALLATRQQSVATVSMEKFFLSKRQQPPRYLAIVWLVTDDCRDEAGEDEAGPG